VIVCSESALKDAIVAANTAGSGVSRTQRLLGGPALSAGQTRSFVAAGSCGVPSSARSLSVNVTATGATADGFLRFQPSGSPTPTVSTLNFHAGQTRAGNAVLDLGSGGNFDATFGAASGAVDLVVDVAGYFE
jgi:hypothetical protein